jgi:hypothetical protein
MEYFHSLDFGLKQMLLHFNMKYGKALTHDLEAFNRCVVSKCISYKAWKKRINENPGDTVEHWDAYLLRDCERVEELLYRRAWLCTTGTQLEQNDVNALAFINTNTLYKVCKRLVKTLNVPALDFMQYLIKRNRFKFTSCSHATFV